MPLVYQQNINEHTKIGVWHIAEPESFYLSRVSLRNRIAHPAKRLQHLAGRLLLKELFVDFPIELIQISDTKKPFLLNDIFYFSIAHCGAYAAVIASRKNRVGIDIETPTVKINNIKDKYLSENEQDLLRTLMLTTEQQLTFGWSIKEAMFKWHGDGGVDFKKHLIIDEVIQHQDKWIAHCFFKKENAIQLELHSIYINECFLTWVVT